MGPIRLDDKPCLFAYKVGDVRAYRLLAAKLHSVEATITQKPPKHTLGGSLGAT
jgi:hypothetical protein